MSPKCKSKRGNPIVYLDQLITKGWCHGSYPGSYPTGSPIATRLGLISSLTSRLFESNRLKKPLLIQTSAHVTYILGQSFQVYGFPLEINYLTTVLSLWWGFSILMTVRRWVSLYWDSILGPVSISDKTSYRKISQSLEAARFVFRIVRPLWNLHLGSTAAGVPVKSQNDTNILRPNLAPSRLYDISR